MRPPARHGEQSVRVRRAGAPSPREADANGDPPDPEFFSGHCFSRYEPGYRSGYGTLFLPS